MADDNEIGIELVARYDELTTALNESRDQMGSWLSDISGLLEGIQESSEATAKGVEAALEKMTENASESEGKLAEAFDKMRESAMHLLEILGLFEGVKILKETVEGAMEASEALSQMSQRTGVTVGILSEIKFAAESSGVSFDRLTMATGVLDQKFLAINQGGGAPGLRQAIVDLGIDINAGPIQALEQMSERLVETQGNTQEYMKVLGEMRDVLGRSALEFVPMLLHFDEFRDKAKEVGATLSVDTVEAATKAQEAFNMLGAEWDAAKIKLAGALSPELTILAEKLQGISEWVLKLANDGTLSSWIETLSLDALEVSKSFAVWIENLESLLGHVAGLLGPLGKLVEWMLGATAVAGDLAIGNVSGARDVGLWLLGIDEGAAKTQNSMTEAISEMERQILEFHQKADAARNDPFASAKVIEGDGTEEKPKLPASNAEIKAAAEEAKKAAAEHVRELNATFADFVSEQKLEIAEANGTAASKIEAYKKVYDEAVSLFGEQSKQARAAMVEELNAQKQAATEARQLQTEQITDSQKAASERFDIEKAQIAAEYGIYTAQYGDKAQLKASELQDLRAALDREYDEELTAANKKIELWAAFPKEEEKYLKEREDLELKHQKSSIESDAQIAEAQIAAAKETESEWDSAMGTLIQPFDTMVDAVIRGTTTMQQAWSNMLQSMVLAVAKSGIESLLLGGKEGTLGNTLFGGGILNALIAPLTGASGGLGLLGKMAGQQQPAAPGAGAAGSTPSAAATIGTAAVGSAVQGANQFGPMQTAFTAAINGMRAAATGFGTFLKGIFGGSGGGASATGGGASAAGAGGAAAGGGSSPFSGMAAQFNQSLTVMHGPATAFASFMRQIFSGGGGAGGAGGAAAGGVGQAASMFSTLPTSLQTALTSMRGMATGFASFFVQALSNIIPGFSGLVQTIGQLFGLIGPAAQAAATTTVASNELMIVSAAGLAGANMTASFSGAPWPVDMGAGAAGAEAFMEAMSYAGSFEHGGITDGGGMAMLHPREMVLPEYLSKGFQDMIRNGGSASNGMDSSGGNAAGLSLTIHHAPVINGSGLSQAQLEQMLARSADKLGRIMIQKIRDNQHLTVGQRFRQ